MCVSDYIIIKTLRSEEMKKAKFFLQITKKSDGRMCCVWEYMCEWEIISILYFISMVNSKIRKKMILSPMVMIMRY